MNDCTELSKGWIRVKLGDIARIVNITERNPIEKGLERFVGLEHIDPESLHIGRWGMIKEGTSFQRRFSKGQILLGKRRAYLRKVAVPDFDGLCSSDILVIEAKGGMVIPDLLPFLFQDERFLDFAVRTSSGSLSPRTKWKYLSKYEIVLPPVSGQIRIAKLLLAAEDCLIKYEYFIEKSENLKRLLLGELLTKGIGHVDFGETSMGKMPLEWKAVKLGDCALIKGRIGWRGLKASEYTETGPYLIANKHIKNHNITWDTCDHLSEFRYEESPEIQLKKNDVIISKDGTIGETAIVDCLPDKATINSTMMLVRPVTGDLTPRFLFYFLQSPRFRRFIAQRVSGTSVPHLFQEDMKNLVITLPPVVEQEQITRILTLLDESIREIRKNVSEIKALKAKLTSHLLSGGLNA